MQAEELRVTVRAFQECRILLTAIELNLFSAIGQGASAPEVAMRTDCEPRAIGRLLNALTALGLLTKTGERFANAPLAARLLVDSSPENERPSLLHDVERWNTWSGLTARVRGMAKPEEHRALNIGRHRALLAMLDRKAVERAPKLVAAIGCEGVTRLLDVGGGSAAYSIAFARASAAIEAEVFELPEVVPITQEYIERAGAQQRVVVRGGDLLADELTATQDTDTPSDGCYHLILLFSVTHILDEEQNRSLLARCYRALVPGGRVAIHDHIMNEGKTQPRAGAIFAINMLVATKGGGTYSRADYEGWLAEAGFVSIEQKPLQDASTAVLIARRGT